MARADDLAALIAPSRRSEVSVSQGFLTAWNGATFANTVSVDGATFTNLPIVGTASPGALAAGMLVLLLRVRSTYYILGKILTP